MKNINLNLFYIILSLKSNKTKIEIKNKAK